MLSAIVKQLSEIHVNTRTTENEITDCDITEFETTDFDKTRY